jgi:hypothetical protein
MSEPPPEGLQFARLMMVLSSVSPIFLLWAMRGTCVMPTPVFVGLCLALVILPNAFLWLRIRISRSKQDKRELAVGHAEDHRDHILVYLFAILLPFYSEDLDTWRQFLSSVAALGFIVFLFWHLNLHYMNLAFAVRGYRVFTVYPPDDDNSHSGDAACVLITRRGSVRPNQRIVANRLSNTVYLEDAG